MRGEAAGIGTAVTVVSVLVVGLTVALLALAVLLRGRDLGITAIVAAGLGILVVWTFTHAPVAYELNGETLTVRFRSGSKQFGPVVSCRPAEEPISFARRLWGNGGLFAITGLYQDKTQGRFRAFVTDPHRLVLVQTAQDEKIVISPSNAPEWKATR